MDFQTRSADGQTFRFCDSGEGPPVATTRGLRTLYVAFTRPTRRLTVLHAEPLPVELH